MSEQDASTRRDHYRRSGSATEYDALLGLGSYEPRRGGGLRSVRELLRPLGRAAPLLAPESGTPHPW